MTKNYFAIERNQQTLDHVLIRDNEGNILFEDLMNMSYEEIKNYEDLDAFVVCIMDATNHHFGESDEQTCVVLVGEDEVFIWGFIMGPGEKDGDVNYVLVDWQKDGKKFRYQPEE